MTTIRPRLLLAINLVLSLTGVSCAVAPQGTPHEDVSAVQGKLAISLLASDDVSGFSFEVTNASGMVVASRYVPLEMETLDPTLVDTSAGALGTMHHFSDALFVLPPGTYKVTATPMESEKTPSMLCAPATDTAMITESSTTEIVLVSECKATANGALDVVAILDHPPQITDLKIQSSKFGTTCECLTANVTAADPDGDAVDYTWEIVTKPNGAQYNSHSAGSAFNFQAHNPGNYEVKITVCDAKPKPLCSSLTFPLHISGQASECSVTAQELDTIIAIDTTGSMAAHIENLGAHIPDVLDAVTTGNFRYALVDYRDFPVAPYGMAGDKPYDKALDFVTDHAAVATAVQNLPTGGGGDNPESVYSALIRSINNEGFASPWRADAARAILLIGDGPAHDPEPMTGYTLMDLVNAAKAAHVHVFTIAVTHGVPGLDDDTRASFKAIAAGTEGESFEAVNVDTIDETVGMALSQIKAESICPAPPPTPGVAATP